MKDITVQRINMSERQAPLYERYAGKPDAAQITDFAICTSNVTPADNPLRGDLELTHARDARVKVGVHRAVGGDSDYPTPGDILCGALAACLDSTIRVIANRLGVTLESLSVAVTGEVDVRGTLRASDECPVAFQAMRTHVDVQVSDDVDEALVTQLIKAAEYSCVVLQTLRNPPNTPLTAVINGADEIAIAV